MTPEAPSVLFTFATCMSWYCCRVSWCLSSCEIRLTTNRAINSFPRENAGINFRMTMILRTGLVALLLVSAASASQPPESGRDQYRAHENVPHPPQLLSEATDQAVDVHQSPGDDPLIKSEYDKKSEEPHQLQSLSPKRQVETNGKSSNPKATISKDEERGKREIITSTNLISQFYSWPPHAIVQVPPLQSFSVWQPQVYQISRPYVIPVWGSPGRIPIYFPPQPLFLNPGYPAHNPPRSYLPPLPPTPTPAPSPTPTPPTPDRSYLPTEQNATTVSTTNDGTEMETVVKFGDGPVWDSVPNNQGSSTTMRPTRRTRRPGQAPATHPPLVHSNQTPAAGGNQLSNEAAVQPPPAIPERESVNNVLQPPPAEISRQSTTPRPQLPQTGGRQPSRCVWAIISCCSAASSDISYSCFEQLGCTGAFWGASPCESDFAKAAVENVLNYYNTK